MAKIGHNAVHPSETAMIAYQLSGLKRAKDDKASSDGTYRSFLSRLEAKGINLKAAKDAVRIAAKGKVTDEIAYLKALFQYLKILGAPLELPQAELFPVADLKQTPEEKAHELGYGSGILGDGQDKNPYGPETDNGQAWLNGWNEGCSEYGELRAQDEAEAAAEADENGEE